MSYGLVLAFDNVDEQAYWQVNAELGIDHDGTGDWPADLLFHSGGKTDSGWIVTEVWTSKAAQEEFMASRLGPALGKVGLPEPSQVIEADVVNTHSA